MNQSIQNYLSEKASEHKHIAEQYPNDKKGILYTTISKIEKTAAQEFEETEKIINKIHSK